MFHRQQACLYVKHKNSLDWLKTIITPNNSEFRGNIATITLIVKQRIVIIVCMKKFSTNTLSWTKWKDPVTKKLKHNESQLAIQYELTTLLYF